MSRSRSATPEILTPSRRSRARLKPRPSRWSARTPHGRSDRLEEAMPAAHSIARSATAIPVFAERPPRRLKQIELGRLSKHLRKAKLYQRSSYYDERRTTGICGACGQRAGAIGARRAADREGRESQPRPRRVSRQPGDARARGGADRPRRRGYGRARAVAVAFSVRAERLRGQRAELQRPAQQFSQRRPQPPARTADHLVGGVSRSRPPPRYQSLRRLLPEPFPGQGSGRARRADHRSVRRREDSRARRDSRAPDANLRTAGRAESGDAAGARRAAYPGANPAQPEDHLYGRVGLDPRALGARPHHHARAALARRAGRARWPVRAARMLQAGARRLPEFSFAGARSSGGRGGARSGAAPDPASRVDKL